MEFLFGLADSIAVIHWGQVIAKGNARGVARESVGEEFEPGQAAMMLQLDHVDTYYGETQVLFDVSLNVAQGEAVALLGPNGAGKTTTLRSVLGLNRPREGEISFNGARDQRSADPRNRPRGRRLGAGRPAAVPDADGGAQPRYRAQAKPIPLVVAQGDVRDILARSST